MADALETMARLALEVEAGLPLAPEAVRLGEDGQVHVRRDAAASRHHFVLDGLQFHVSLTPETGADGALHTLVQIWAEVGYLPYTIESPDKRARLLAVLRAARWLGRARFHVDEGQKILVLGQSRVPGLCTLPDLMHELVQFLQEARPYLRVLGGML